MVWRRTASGRHHGELGAHSHDPERHLALYNPGYSVRGYFQPSLCWDGVFFSAVAWTYLLPYESMAKVACPTEGALQRLYRLDDMPTWKAVWPVFFGRNPYLDHFSRMAFFCWPVAVFGRMQPVFFQQIVDEKP